MQVMKVTVFSNIISSMEKPTFNYLGNKQFIHLYSLTAQLPKVTQHLVKVYSSSAPAVASSACLGMAYNI